MRPLPTTARSSGPVMAQPSSHTRFGGSDQPLAHGARRLKNMFGAGKAAAHGKAVPTQIGQDAEYVQISRVVAAKQNGAPQERFLFYQSRDSRALVHALGPGLDHRLA